jgi:hypothetical protein
VCAQHTAATDHVQKIVTKGSINKNDQDSVHHQFILFSHCAVFAAAAKAGARSIAPPATAISRLLFLAQRRR